MAWMIAGNLGPHSEGNYDGSGWLWELRRGGAEGLEASRVFVLVSRSALDSDRIECDDTVAAIETEGCSETERVAGLETLPRIISCSTTIVEDIYV